MKIGRMIKTEGEYPKGTLIALHPGPGTAGALYVDEVRFDAWVAAEVLAPIREKADPEDGETKAVPVPVRKKGGSR